MKIVLTKNEFEKAVASMGDFFGFTEESDFEYIDARNFLDNLSSYTEQTLDFDPSKDIPYIDYLSNNNYYISYNDKEIPIEKYVKENHNFIMEIYYKNYRKGQSQQFKR